MEESRKREVEKRGIFNEDGDIDQIGRASCRERE